MRSILQEEVTIHSNITIWYTNLFLCNKLWKFRQQRQQWIKNGRKLILAWNPTKVKSKKEVIDEARTKGERVHFAWLMSTCHLTKAELETKHQKYKGRVALRSDILKRRFRVLCSTYLTKVISITNDCSKSHGYHFQTAGYPFVNKSKMEGASTWLSVPKSQFPDIWIRLPKHTWAKSWSSMEDPVVPLERNLCGHPLARLYCVAEKVLWFNSQGPKNWIRIM